MTTVTFDVHGTPAAQGSKTAIRNAAGRIIGSRESSKKVQPWRSAVAAAAADQVPIVGCLDGPMLIIAEFRFAMPKSRPKWQRNLGVAYRAGMPDLDKVMRSTGDAIKEAGLIVDDSLLVAERISKIEVWQAWTGATICLRTLDPLKAQVRGCGQ